MRRQQRLGVCGGMNYSIPWINVMLGLEMLFALHAHHRYAGYRRLAGQEG